MIAAALDPPEATVSGVVFEDRNGTTGSTPVSGLAGVSVSDGAADRRDRRRRAATTRLDVERRTSTWSSSPSRPATVVPTDAVHDPEVLPQPRSARRRRRAGADFALSAGPASAATASPSPTSPTRTSTPSWPSRSPRSTRPADLAFIQVSGDLTNNATDAEFEYYKAGTAALEGAGLAGRRQPRVLGGGATYADRIDNYRKHVGPEWYSFDYGDRHFLVLENNGAAPFAEQLEWVKADLAENVTPGKQRGRAHPPADERPVRLAVGVRRVRQGARAVRRRADPGRPRALQRRRDRRATSPAPRSTSRPCRARTRSTTRPAGSASSTWTARPSTTRSGCTAREGPHHRQPGARAPVPLDRFPGSRSTPTTPATRSAASATGSTAAAGTAAVHRRVHLVRRTAEPRAAPASTRSTWRPPTRAGDLDRTSDFTLTTRRRSSRSPGADWSQHHGDAAHSGVAADVHRGRSAAGLVVPHEGHLPHRLARDRRRRRVRRYAGRER